MARVDELLIDALKQALAEPGEQRLFKSGKLDGLFAGRTGANGAAAARALHDGLLEVLRTETKGKTSTEWVRPTPRATEFLHEHESPAQALKDLNAILQSTRQGVPLWLEEMRRELQTLTSRLALEAERWTHRLDALSQHALEALCRSEAAGPLLPDGVSVDIPWAAQALAYLDRRRAGGAPAKCPLPELFAAVRDQNADLTITAFHDRLRRLHERRALQLMPFEGSPSEIPEPEYALLDGARLLYYAARA